MRTGIPLTTHRPPDKFETRKNATLDNFITRTGVMVTEKETEAEIAALKRGSVTAFENLFRKWKDPVYGYVLRMVRDDALAHDVTQDVFLRVMKAAASYDHRGRLRQWLFTIASNLVADHVRKLKRRREVQVEEPAAIDTPAGEALRSLPEDAFASAELREVVLQALDRLPTEQRSVLLMRQYAQLTFREIAALEDCSINTVLSRMRYGLRNLKKILADTFGEKEKDELQRS